MPPKTPGKNNKNLKQRQVPKNTSVAELPKWPVLQPLVPASDLALETLLEGQIILIRNLFTSTLCKQLVSFLSTLPLQTTPGQPKEGEAVRVNDRAQFDDPVFAEQLWSSTSLRTLVSGLGEATNVDEKAEGERRRNLWGGEVLGLNPRIRIYRYREGQFFAQHYDESNVLSFPSTPSKPAKTTWTLLIYLTGPATGCVGGETVFYPDLGQAKNFSRTSHTQTEPLVVGLEVGTALLHKHGQDCLLHEGRKVEKGEKWVVRSDLCVSR